MSTASFRCIHNRVSRLNRIYVIATETANRFLFLNDPRYKSNSQDLCEINFHISLILLWVISNSR